MIFLDAIAGPILFLPAFGFFVLIAAVLSLVVLTMIIIALFQKHAGQQKEKSNEDNEPTAH